MGRLRLSRREKRRLREGLSIGWCARNEGEEKKRPSAEPSRIYQLQLLTVVDTFRVGFSGILTSVGVSVNSGV